MAGTRNVPNDSITDRVAMRRAIRDVPEFRITTLSYPDRAANQHIRDMAQIARIKLSGPINDGWFVTPMYQDGTVGEPRRFDTLEAARAFAESEYPDTPISVAHHTQSRTKAKRVKIPLFADQVPRQTDSTDDQPKPD